MHAREGDGLENLLQPKGAHHPPDWRFVQVSEARGGASQECVAILSETYGNWSFGTRWIDPRCSDSQMLGACGRASPFWHASTPRSNLDEKRLRGASARRSAGRSEKTVGRISCTPEWPKHRVFGHEWLFDDASHEAE